MNKPFVSFIIVSRNEEKYISRCIDSILKQTYPKDLYELIIVDGESTDKTLSIINDIIEEEKKISPFFKIRVLKNEKLILSSGWNIGIKASNGDYVVRVDAHSEVAKDFIEKSVETILRHDAICVGGKLVTKPLEGDDGAVSKVLSSPFGVGNSSFRVSNKAGYSDTAVYGLYNKIVFEKVGYFDERFVRNQDMEFHSRVKRAGEKFYFNPEIVSVYYSRNTIKKMLKQGFQNGKWGMILLKHDMKGPSLRHLVPFLFVLYLFLSIGFGFLFHPIWYLCIGVVFLHLILGFVFSIKKTKRFVEIVKMPIMFFLLHFMYGLGFIAGLFKHI